jgi:hypothetical protein
MSFIAPLAESLKSVAEAEEGAQAKALVESV